MKKLTPKTFDLSEEEHLWVRPGEDFEFILDFNEDMSAATFELIYGEQEWPYMSATYDKIPETSTNSGWALEANEFNVANSVIRWLIPSSTIDSWTNKHLDLRLKVTKGGREWIAIDRTLVVAQGN